MIKKKPVARLETRQKLRNAFKKMKARGETPFRDGKEKRSGDSGTSRDD